MSKPAPKWVPVIREGNPFDSRADEVRVLDAQRDNPRLPGEDINAWMQRVNVAAGLMLLGDCDEITGG